MLEKYGRKGTEFDGVFFTEGPIEHGEVLGQISEISNRQNVNLDEFKKIISLKVKSMGGNALDNFNYVQQGSVWSFSSVRWKVTGRVIKATEG